MKELNTGGESGIIASQRTEDSLARKGIKFHPRGKDQHARYVERRGALLRDTVHRVEGQMEEEGLTGIPFESILAECVFCGNAMITVNGSTPYNAVYGRVPHILPSMEQVEPPGAPGLRSGATLAHTQAPRSQRPGYGRGLGPRQAWASVEHSHHHASSEA